MNRENLQRMADYIRTISAENFDMYVYREGDHLVQYSSSECKTVGCVIGHCTILDVENLPRNGDGSGSILFATWSETFTGLEACSKEWDWCFSYKWSTVDNSPEGAARRIEHMLDKGVPHNFHRHSLQIGVKWEY
jgi:hypothetical protein